jgi:hypothetical protein
MSWLTNEEIFVPKINNNKGPTHSEDDILVDGYILQSVSGESEKILDMLACPSIRWRG